MSAPEAPVPGTGGAAAGGTASWHALARAAARRREAADAPEELRQLLILDVAGTPYAVPVERVREIVRIRPITPIPRVSPDVRGVISLRGEIVEVVELRRRLGLAPARDTRSTRIVVVYSEDEGVAAILVDAVTEVLRVADEAARATAPGEVAAVESLCVRGTDFVSLLDLDRVLAVDGGS